MVPTGWTGAVCGAGAFASVLAVVSGLPAAAEELGAPHPAAFAVTLSFDDVVDESGVTTDANPTPFSSTPVFRLGLPRLDPHAAALTSRIGGSPDNACAGDLCQAVSARMSVAAENNDWRVSLGARANVADRLTSFTSSDGGAQPNWYLFVAADAQAMSWNFRSRDQDSSPVRLDDMRLIGDAQAGVGAHVAGGDLAIGYVTREIHHMGAKRQESFVGLTFGWSGQ